MGLKVVAGSVAATLRPGVLDSHLVAVSFGYGLAMLCCAYRSSAAGSTWPTDSS